jgi:hypothetical protein
MITLTLTRHFIDNWMKRVSNGIAPDIQAVASVLSGAIRIQKGRRFVLQNGESYTTLSMFWHPELRIVVSIDPVTSRCVTVATDTMGGERDKQRLKAVKRSKSAGYVAMTMHGM